MPLAAELVAFLNRFGFGHVFTFFGGAVETGAFLVVNVRFAVNPNQAMASAGCGSFHRGLSTRSLCFSGGWCRRIRCCRRILRLKQITQTEFTR